MKTLTRLALCVFVFLAVACCNCRVAVAESARALSAGDSGFFAETIPFELYDNLVFLQVRVNGAGPYSFLLDTGANTPVLDEGLAQSVGLAQERYRNESVGTGESQARLGFAKRVALTVGTANLPARTAVVVSLAELEARIGHQIDGIVGADIFERYAVTIDSAVGTLTLEDPRSAPYHGSGEIIPIRISGGRPFLKASVTPVGAATIDAELVIDTGDNGALAFHTPFVNKHNLRTSSQKLIPHLSKGLSGDSRNWRGRARVLRIGGIVIDRPLASFSEASAGSDADSSYDGVIGGQILQRFRIILNYTRRRLILEPNATSTSPYDADMSGLTLTGRGPDFRTVVVEGVDAGSPAEEAGVKINDAIETIDGQSVRDSPLPSIKEQFKQDGRQYVLGIKREKALIQITVRLRRAI